MKNEQSCVAFRVPDFIDSDGVEYTDIEVIVEMDGDIRDTVQLVKTLERPLTMGGAARQQACASRREKRRAGWKKTFRRCYWATLLDNLLKAEVETCA
jgi:hypothetical protein